MNLLEVKKIKLSCLCYKNKEVLIKDLLDKNNKYITINKLSNSNLLSSSSNIFDVNNDDEGFKCKKHKYYFKYYCIKCHLNICDKCKKEDERKYNFFHFKYNELVFKKIENKKIDKLITIINTKNVNLNVNENNIKLLRFDDNDILKR